jgi:leucine dehydrogenase
MGCTVEDMGMISRVNPYVVGLAHEKGSGDPSYFTAWGTFRGIQAVCQKMFKNSSLQDKVIAVQGLGSVGIKLVELLFWAGARLIVSDLNEKKAEKIAKQFGAKICSPQEILSVECDIFAPCALGGILNEKNIPRFCCQAVAGCANNQLLHDRDAEELRRRRILYAPDFVINGGGLINVTVEISPCGYHPSIAQKKTHGIYDQLLAIFEIADQNGYSTNQAAMALADYRLKYEIGKREQPPIFHTHEK